MGDSGSYLATAYRNYIPPDRSFVYGYLLKAIALWPHSLLTVVQTQVAISAASCSVLAWLLVRHLRLPLLPAAILAALCAVEPLQLLSERYVLTEAGTTLLFSLSIWTAFSYHENGRLWLLPVTALLGAMLISFRVAYLPFVLASSVLIPLLSPRARAAIQAARRRRASTWRAWMPIALSLVLSVVVSQVALREYRILYRSIFNARLWPAYIYHDGYFLLSDFAPLVAPEDYPIARDRSWVFSRIKVPLGDRRLREQQHWFSDGICQVIKRVPGQGEYRGNRMARLTALHAIRRAPLRAIDLVLASASDYFDVEYLRQSIALDQGSGLRLSPANAERIQQLFGFAPTSEDDNSMVRRWSRLAWPWYIALLVVPGVYVAALLLLWRRARTIDWYLALPATLIVFTSTVLVGRPTVRYETTLAWLAFLIAGRMLVLCSPKTAGTVDDGRRSRVLVKGSTAFPIRLFRRKL